MADDGLIFKFFSRILPRFKTPFIASISTGMFAGAWACILDLHELVEMMSIGTLMAYTCVNICVLILRYWDETSPDDKDASASNFSMIRRLINNKYSQPTKFSSNLVKWMLLTCVLLIILLSLILSKIDLDKWYSLTIIALIIIMLMFFSFLIWRQPQVSSIITFKVSTSKWK